MIYGYAIVSTKEENEAQQLVALQKFGVTEYMLKNNLAMHGLVRS